MTNIEKLWDLYRESCRKVYELERKYKAENALEKSYATFTYFELNDQCGKMNGILRCIEALAEDEHDAWKRAVDIFCEENEFPKEVEFGRWVPVDKKPQPDQVGCKVLVSAENRYGQANVFTAFTGYGEQSFPWFTTDRTKSDTSGKLSDCWTVTAWMPMPEPYKRDKPEEEEEEEEAENENAE